VARRGSAQHRRFGPYVVPGTGFEPVCLSAARFKFDLTPSLTVRGRSWESQPPWAAPLRLLVNRGELQPLLQPRPSLRTRGGMVRSGHSGRGSSRGWQTRTGAGCCTLLLQCSRHPCWRTTRLAGGPAVFQRRSSRYPNESDPRRNDWLA
jgi:hypothetical protein